MDDNNSRKTRRRVGFSASKLGKAKALSLLKKSSIARIKIRKNIAQGTMPIVSKFVADNI